VFSEGIFNWDQVKQEFSGWYGAMVMLSVKSDFFCWLAYLRMGGRKEGLVCSYLGVSVVFVSLARFPCQARQNRWRNGKDLDAYGRV